MLLLLTAGLAATLEMEETTEAGDLADPDTVDTTTWDPFEAVTVQPARPEILLPSDSSFGPLFGEVTPDRIQQTLHDLTTHKGVDGNGPTQTCSPIAVIKH